MGVDLSIIKIQTNELDVKNNQVLFGITASAWRFQVSPVVEWGNNGSCAVTSYAAKVNVMEGNSFYPRGVGTALDIDCRNAPGNLS